MGSLLLKGPTREPDSITRDEHTRQQITLNAQRALVAACSSE
jgi:hypothetical protein